MRLAQAGKRALLISREWAGRVAADRRILVVVGGVVAVAKWLGSLLALIMFSWSCAQSERQASTGQVEKRRRGNKLM